MKRYIKSMGLVHPATTIPAHNAYNPSIDKSTFRHLVAISNAAGSAHLIDAIIEIVIADINADNNAGIVPNQDIRNYYHDYYDMVVNNRLANSILVNNLFSLV